MNRAILFGLPALFALGAAACGGTVDTAAQDGSVADAASDAPSSADGALEAGPLACGKVICQGTEYCVHPCCGGPAPACLPIPDGGQCPAGTTLANCPNGPGCQMNPCTPPPPFCSPKKDACPGGGGAANGREVSCLCA